MKRVKISNERIGEVMKWLGENNVKYRQTAEFERGCEFELNNEDAQLLEALKKGGDKK